MELHQGGVSMELSHDTTLKVFLCRMARTGEGVAARPVPPPQVYMQPNGVKVWRMDGGYRYQPPSLKCITNLFLDRTKPNESPNVNLYQSVQKVVDKLLDLVEDKLLGLEVSGIPCISSYVVISSRVESIC